MYQQHQVMILTHKQINTPWGANNESGVVHKDCQRKGLNIADFDSVQEYIELELSHKTGKSKGYDLVCDAGSSRWLLKNKDRISLYFFAFSSSCNVDNILEHTF